MLKERQFETRAERDKFYQEVRLTHRDVIRFTEQVGGHIVWAVQYGEPRRQNPILEAIAEAMPEELVQITLEKETQNGLTEEKETETVSGKTTLSEAGDSQLSRLQSET